MIAVVVVSSSGGSSNGVSSGRSRCDGVLPSQILF